MLIVVGYFRDFALNIPSGVFIAMCGVFRSIYLMRRRRHIHNINRWLWGILMTTFSVSMKNSVNMEYSQFPFTHVVITAPSAAAIKCYEEQMEGLRISCGILTTQVIVCADPDGLRIGSGGGTLNALAQLDSLIGSTSLAQACVLIVHSGGDSRRSPLHSVCGKAWVSINTAPIQTPMQLLVKEIGAFCQGLTMPAMVVASSDVLLDLIVTGGGTNTLSNLSSSGSGGSGSSDCSSSLIAPNAITVAAVPEDPSVARNHGVLVPAVTTTGSSSSSSIVQKYLQKPSISDMHAAGAIDLLTGNAYVDTGLVIATGTAYTALLTMMDHALVKKCTVRGIHSNGGSSSGNGSISSKGIGSTGLGSNFRVSESASDVLRLELYSDILMALCTSEGPCTLTQYYSRLGLTPAVVDASIAGKNGITAQIYSTALTVLWEALHEIPLFVAAINNGKFCHLGTSAELLQILGSPSSDTLTYADEASGNTNKRSSSSNDKSIVFGRKYGLHMCVNSMGGSTANGVVLNSLLTMKLELNDEAGAGAEEVCHNDRLIEHSVVLAACNSDPTAAGTVASHVGLPLGSHLRLQSNTMVQQVYLRHNRWQGQGYKKYEPEFSRIAVVVLGLKDDVKSVFKETADVVLSAGAGALPTTGSDKSVSVGACGTSWETIFNLTHMQPEELWETGVERSLWTAKIFAVAEERFVPGSKGRMRLHLVPSASAGVEVEIDAQLSEAEVHLALTWLQHAHKYSQPMHIPVAAAVSEEVSVAIEHWKCSKRLSLSDLLREGDARQMYRWRGMLGVVTCAATAIASPADSVIYLSAVHLAYRNLTSCHAYMHAEREFAEQLPYNSTKSASSTTFTTTATSLILAMWCARMCLSPVNTPRTLLCTVTAGLSDCIEAFAKYARVENIAALLLLIEPFDAFWHAVISADAATSPLVAVHWLRHVAGPIGQVLAQKAVCAALKYVPAAMQPRMFFILAWLDNTEAGAEEVKKGPLWEVLSKKEEEKESAQVGWRAVGLYFADTVECEICGGENRSGTENSSSDRLSKPKPTYALGSLSGTFEALAQRLISSHVQKSLAIQLPAMTSRTGTSSGTMAIALNRVVIARAPARIDLTGGWSDTPPLCYERAGSVLNVGVMVDGKRPLVCCARGISRPLLVLHMLQVQGQREENKHYDSSSSSSSTSAVRLCGPKVEVSTWEDLEDVTQPHAVGALLKACLLAMQVIERPTPTSTPSVSVSASTSRVETLEQQLLTRYGGGIELACISTLPAGSGMGGSSILAAAIITSLSALLDRVQSEEQLVYCVSLVEQLLTTGGGWQDQCGCLPGGFKICRSSGRLPLEVKVRKFDKDLPQEFVTLFEHRTLLVYSGVPRLARNILVNALRTFSILPLNTGVGNGSGKGSTVNQLVSEAEDAAAELLSFSAEASTATATNVPITTSTEAALQTLGKRLSHYWHLKTMMAKGSEPQHVATLLAKLRPYCYGLGLCGAGAGGFAVCILKESNEKAVQHFRAAVSEVDAHLTVHRVQVDMTGVFAQSVHFPEQNSIVDFLTQNL